MRTYNEEQRAKLKRRQALVDTVTVGIAVVSGVLAIGLGVWILVQLIN